MGQVLTNTAGRFLLRARQVGAHHITVERIGYAKRTTEHFDPRRDTTLIRIDVPVEPVIISGLNVAGERRCEVRPEEGRVTARVWEEARKALAAEAWTRGVAGYRYTLQRYQRTLGPYGHVVVSMAEDTAHDLEAAFASVPPGSLATVGFVQPMPDSTTRYYAPDAEALLSDFFLDTHCFAATRDEDGRIGLSFRPIPGRSLPEIRGVLWLNRDTFELEELLFDYINVRSIVERGWAGGKIEFARLLGGEWIVQRWLVRIPILEVRSRNRVRRTGYLDTGGTTTRVTDSEGKVVWISRQPSPGAGRPKGSRNRARWPDVVEALRDMAPAALDTLHDLLADPEAPALVRFKAGSLVLDRAYGRPVPLSGRFEVKTRDERAAAGKIGQGFGTPTALASPLTDDREVPRGMGRVEIG